MRHRILVIEDEVLIAMLVADAIEAGGFEVIGPCQTVSQALDQLSIPDCCDGAILDASLRGESALPVARALTELGIPFVVATGYDSSQLPDYMAAVPVLVKPLDTGTVVESMRRLLAAN